MGWNRTNKWKHISVVISNVSHNYLSSLNSGANVTSSDLNNIKVYNKHNNVTDTHCSIPNTFSGNWQGLIDRVDIRIQSKNSLSVLLKFYFGKKQNSSISNLKEWLSVNTWTIVKNGRSHYAMSTWAQNAWLKEQNEHEMSDSMSKWMHHGLLKEQMNTKMRKAESKWSKMCYSMSKWAQHE